MLSGLVPAANAVEPASAPGIVGKAREVRTTWTDEFGVSRPTGVTYVPQRNEFLVAEASGASTQVLRLDRDENPQGELELPAVSDPSTLAFDAATNLLTAVSGDELVVAPGSAITTARPPVERKDISDLGLQDATSATFDAASGTWFVLDAGGPALVTVPEVAEDPGSGERLPAPALAGKDLQGIAFNPSDGLVYVGSADGLLIGLDGSGSVAKTYSLDGIDLRDPRAMTFAPSTDSTDATETQSLFIADAGDQTRLGGVTEVTLAAVTALDVPVDAGTLVQTIDTSAFSPGSPDPSGVTYVPAADRLWICDSEVEEVTGAGYHGVNLWQITRSGAVTDTGTTYPAVSKEPNGLGYIAASNTLLISDDSLRRIHLVRPGPDGRFGTSDDIVTFINTLAYGSDDTEDPTLDPVSGHIFFLDGVDTEVFRIDPVNGVFGDGNDVTTHFDVGQYGITDTEALEYYPPHDSLIVGNRTGRSLIEVTKTGELLRTIDL
ncbi:MAG TPA: hypothetical protein VFX21_13615, partial [Acidimicrobiia bacterium]|nr:hypothetical protein [Acidimicrobiia bacterium]